MIAPYEGRCVDGPFDEAWMIADRDHFGVEDNSDCDPPIRLGTYYWHKDQWNWSSERNAS